MARIGYTKETYRTAGDAARQRALEFAADNGGVITTHPLFAHKGIRPCYVVFPDLDAAQSAIKDGAEVVTG